MKLTELKAPVEGWGMSIWELEIYGLPPQQQSQSDSQPIT